MLEQISASQQIGRSLYKILQERNELESEIKDQSGEITDEQDIIWRNQELELKDKIDSYGYALEQLGADLAKIEYLKREASDRIARAEAKTHNIVKRLQKRLYYLSEGSPLRGHIYSFLPYLSKRRSIGSVDLVEDDKVFLTLEITARNFNDLLEAWVKLNGDLRVPEYTIKKRESKVSLLPENHPAVIVTTEESVRIK